MTDLAGLLDHPRVKLVAELRPMAGTRFQPTGFPDLGPAVYQGPDGDDLLLVESAQSMANHLERTLWDDDADAPATDVAGLPHVRVTAADGAFLTSSRTEPHRLASAYIKQAIFDGTKGLDLILDRLGLQRGRPIDHGRVQRTVFELDPLGLVHGVFFADDKWYGQPKIARALTAFVEAHGVRPAHSGGVKFDHVSNTGDVAGRAEGRASEAGFGNVPYPRTEFVAERIEASFVVDTSQIARYRLEPRQRELLLGLALMEIRSLLDRGLRLRTACDLDVVSLRGERPDGFVLPGREELVQAVRNRIDGERAPLTGVLGG